LNKRLLSHASTITNNNQTGYKMNKDRNEPIIGLYDYLTTPTTKHPNSDTKYTAFIDLAKAFNSIPHDKLLTVLEFRLEQQNSTFSNYIKNMYNKLYYYNNVDAELSSKTRQECGIKQGCTISSTLFIIYFDLIIDSLSNLMSEEKLQHFIAAYADDLTISCSNENDLRKYMQLTIKLIRMLQLDLNEVKTEILITKPTANAPKSIKVPIVDAEVISFKVIEQARYLGFVFHQDLNFAKTITDLKVTYIISQYSNLLYNQFVPLHVKKLIIQRYLVSKLLSNAPTIGTLLSLNKTNKNTFKNNVSKEFTSLLTNAYAMPNTSRATSEINLYENINMTIPHHFVMLQAYSTIIKLINNHELTIDHVHDRLLTPTPTSPITNLITKMVTKLRKIKTTFVEPIKLTNPPPTPLFRQERWYYNALGALPNKTVDFLCRQQYKTLNTTFGKLKTRQDIRRTVRQNHPIPDAALTLIPIIPQLQQQMNLSPQSTQQLLACINGEEEIQQEYRCTNMYEMHELNIHIAPKLNKNGKKDWFNMLSQSLVMSKYSTLIPTVFSCDNTKASPLFTNKYTPKNSTQITAILFYQRRTAQSSQLTLKNGMLYPKYNWSLIHNLRLCRWKGETFRNNNTIQHICACGQYFDYNHILTCQQYETHRQIAIRATWRVLDHNNVASQITTTIQNIPRFKAKVRQLVDLLVTRPGIVGDTQHVRALKSKTLHQLKQHYNRERFKIKLHNQPMLVIDPMYYLHLIKWRSNNKYLYRLIIDPPWLDENNRTTIKLLLQLVILLYKIPQFESYKKLPTPSTIESYIGRLAVNNHLHYFHSPRTVQIIQYMVQYYNCSLLNLSQQ
jgi:hypothetical protein